MFRKLIETSRLAPILRAVERDRALPLSVLRKKAASYVKAAALSHVYLRSCTKVGRSPRTHGRPFILNDGKLTVGDHFILSSRFVQSHLVVGPGATLEIGDSVSINFGAAISANQSVKIGSGVRMGPYSVVMDGDFHDAEDRSKRSTAPVVIEDDVWLAVRVTVLKGSRIGKGSVITANSVVTGDIPPGSIAGGVPARVLRRIGSVAETSPRPATTGAAVDPSVESRALGIVAQTFGLEGTIDPRWGPREIPKWDSLGQMHLTVALEAEFGIRFTEGQLVGFTDVASVAHAVSQCLADRPTASPTT